jgi:uncharacterized protein (DUF362 family)
MMNMNRRDFVYSLGVLYSAMFTGCWDSLKVLFKKTKGERAPAGRENLFQEEGKSLVAVVGGKDIKAMVREAVSLIGGLERMDVKGKNVLVKPNVVAGRPNPTTTNPKVVGAVVEMLYQGGAKGVFVGDMSALRMLPTKDNMEKTGITRAAEEAGARVLYFEDHEWINVKIPKGRYVREVGVTEWVFRAERVVNLPVIKTHRSAGYSICLKNFVGATHLKQRPYFVDRGHWEEVVAELNLAWSPELNIVDGTRTMVEGGPWRGTERETALVLASGDRIAADVVGMGVIKAFGLWKDAPSRVWEQRQIKRAVEAGLGAKSSEEMKVLASSLDGSQEFNALMEKVRAEIL